MSQILDYIVKHKVVSIMKLAADFKITTKDATARIEKLESTKQLSCGVFDEQG